VTWAIQSNPGSEWTTHRRRAEKLRKEQTMAILDLIGSSSILNAPREKSILGRFMVATQKTLRFRSADERRTT
jgi:hypothetical protein